MATRLGDHAASLREVRLLLEPREARKAGRFLFEGETLVLEAQQSGLVPDEIFTTEAAYGRCPTLRELESAGSALWIVGDRVAKRLSGVETPSGIVAIGRRRLDDLETLLERRGPVLVLAGLSDPGNAGTLLRSAEAFGAAGVVFGPDGVDPYHPKVVRAAMGAIFRVPLAEATPQTLAEAVRGGQRTIAGLSSSGTLDVSALPADAVLVVGQERRGLGPWRTICDREFRISMRPPAESLNAGVAGSIALHEASRRSLG